jgi:hypothetical protein
LEEEYYFGIFLFHPQYDCRRYTLLLISIHQKISPQNVGIAEKFLKIEISRVYPPFFLQNMLLNAYQNGMEQ